jgi:hypothetical protein
LTVIAIADGSIRLICGGCVPDGLGVADGVAEEVDVAVGVGDGLNSPTVDDELGLGAGVTGAGVTGAGVTGVKILGPSIVTNATIELTRNPTTTAI